MARMPDGWVVTVESDRKSLEVRITGSRELVMCKNCKWWDKDQTTDGAKGFCPNTGCCEQPDFYCADGERRDDDADNRR